jgi:hypothetical protein
MDNNTIYRDQTVGSIVNQINNERIADLFNDLSSIKLEELSALTSQDAAFLNALKNIDKIREFLGHPEHILGRDDTKHGEIAEQIEVYIRNARAVLEHQHPNATFDGVSRIAPEDYLINGIQVQSKFINGIRNNLDHVLFHMEKYKYFGRDGSYYHIPRDHHANVLQILQDRKLEGLNDKNISQILEKIKKIEGLSGKNFEEVVQPSISKYNEVQRGVVFTTVDGHEQQLFSRNEELKIEIGDNANKQRDTAYKKSQPNISEGLKAGAYGAIVGGGFSLATSVYKKYKNGKAPFQYSEDDWQDLGADLLKGGSKGSISGLAIYGLTNYSKLTAPLASSFVSTVFGIADLSKNYAQGLIDLDQFVEEGQILCFESGIVTLFSVIGQTAIPIPILGTLIGTFASKTFLSIYKDILKKDEDEFKKIIDLKYNSALNLLNKAYQTAVNQILDEFNRIGSITEMAFNFQVNSFIRLESSIKLANHYGVSNDKILRTIPDIDSFMFG